MGLEEKLGKDGFVLSKLDDLMQWARKNSCMANAYGNFLLCYRNDGGWWHRGLIYQGSVRKCFVFRRVKAT